MNPAALAGRLPGVRGLSIAFAVLTGEVLVLGLYLVETTGAVTDPLRLLYPFVWINAAAVGVWVTDVRTAADTPGSEGASTRYRRLAGVVAVAYLGVLAYVGGVVGPGYDLVSVAAAETASPGWYLSAGLPPGYGPAAVYEGALVTLVLVPYKLVGYAALAYLVYATVLDAAGAAITGVLGLLSCVSCSWPVLAAIVSGVAGSGSAVAAAAYGESLALSTVVFVVTVALLAWRPSFG
jgi:hypothetical protein